ncbi:hypothetical protein AN960_22655 [Bacillus sp. FJAT-25509]|nr:hypothetical protein AN960_22655 [Bacillus sp. FJAT-25509]
MQVLTVCLIYSGVILLYLLFKKVQYNKRQKNVINFFLYYNRRKSNVNRDTKRTGDIIYLMPQSTLNKGILRKRKDDFE